MTLRSERPWTPTAVDGSKTTIRVKRTCENCYRPIGDANDAELDAAMAGTPLPSVADECGCREVVAQLAMFSQRYDAMHHGSTVDGVSHPLWDELGPAAREEYEQESLNTLRAMVHLGWAPLERVLGQMGAHS